MKQNLQKVIKYNEEENLSFYNLNLLKAMQYANTKLLAKKQARFQRTF
jgi:predicted nuclease of restriction endonuclease-like RecB superfamily